MSQGVVRWSEAQADDAAILESAFELVDGEVVVEGDMVLGPLAEVQREHDRLTAQLRGDPADKAFLRTRHTWGGGVVPYTLHSVLGCTVSGARIVGGDSRCLNIQAAIDHWNGHTSVTGVRWEYRQSIDNSRSGVRFTNASGLISGSRSAVGRRPRRQDLHLVGGATEATARHEMGHAMGLFHEHQREERGDFLTFKSEFGNRSWFSSVTNFRTVRDQRHRVRVGRYDYDSLMHYGSVANSLVVGTYPPTLVFGSREELVSWGVSGRLNLPGQPLTDITISPPAVWNSMSRLGFEGTDLRELVVADVDGDGLDDLVGTLDGNYYWSSQGRSGWRRVLGPDGRPVVARTKPFWGEFDDHPGRDVMVWWESRGRLEVASSDGTRWTRSLSGFTPDVAVEDHDRDGFTDVFLLRGSANGFVRVDVIEGGGLRSAAPEPWSRGAARTLGTSFAVVEVAPNTFEPVMFRTGNTAGLVRLRRDGEWATVFNTPYGPLPPHVRRLDQVHFVELDFTVGQRPSIDILTYSQRTATTPLGAPLVIRNAFEAGATIEPLPYPPLTFVEFGADLRTDLVGNFGSPGRVSVLSHNRVERCTASPVPSDLLALATVYNRTRPADLSDRSPGLGCGVPLDAPVALEVAPGERVEIVASFVDPGGQLQGARVVSEYLSAGQGPFVVRDVPLSLSGRADNVEFVFAADEPGLYRVRVLYGARTEAAATWTIVVGRGFCGDGRVDTGEACDAAAANSDSAPNACRTTCNLPSCGDEVTDTSEACDDGDDNSDSVPNACRTSCEIPSCGDGVRDSGESCDDGDENSNTDPNACRTTCVLPRCGDGVMDSGEQCDDAGDNSNTDPNACRTTCVLPRCGDGVVDSGETCDPPGVGTCDAGCGGIVFE